MDITTSYSTRDEAIERGIIAAIEAAVPDVARADDYDVDAIAREVLSTDERGRWQIDVEPDEFWRSVEAHATYRVEVAGETVDTGDVAAIARLISREIPDADAPVFAEELGALPGSLKRSGRCGSVRPGCSSGQTGSMPMVWHGRSTETLRIRMPVRPMNAVAGRSATATSRAARSP